MALDPLGRAEFEAYTRRHDENEDAHSRLIRRLQTEGLNVRLGIELRLSTLERWNQRLLGAVSMLGFLVTAGVIAGVVELLSR